MSRNSSYVGRFAPSPSGPLHFGSLVTALASYLDARARGGRWLVRIEDIDPPREQPGAISAILLSLEAHGLFWDGEIFYQSQRLNAYSDHLNSLLGKDLAYPCDCSRQQIQATQGIYSCRCRNNQALYQQNRNSPCAIRLKVHDLPNSHKHLNPEIQFDDILQGPQRQHLGREVGDFIIRRKDTLFAYQLAVVADDIEQSITHIIRGSDLLDSSARQIFLARLLGAEAPQFGHVPIAINALGQKLSKQNGAPGLINQNAGNNLRRALTSLNLCPPKELYEAPPEHLLNWAIPRWNRQGLPGGLTLMRTDLQ